MTARSPSLTRSPPKPRKLPSLAALAVRSASSTNERAVGVQVTRRAFDLQSGHGFTCFVCGHRLERFAHRLDIGRLDRGVNGLLGRFEFRAVDDIPQQLVVALRRLDDRVYRCKCFLETADRTARTRRCH